VTAVACLVAGIAIGLWLGAEYRARVSAKHAARLRQTIPGHVGRYDSWETR
jgi:uncharacterized membrane protein YfcA